MAHHTSDGTFIKQVTVVLHLSGNTPLRILEIKPQFVLGLGLLQGIALQGQPIQLHGLYIHLLQV